MSAQKHAFSSRPGGRWLLFAVLVITGQPVQGADLLSVYRLAQRNDPVFEAARYTLQAAREKIPQARAGLLPSVSVNGASNYTQVSSTFGDASPVQRGVRAWTWTLQLSQPLLRMQNVYAYAESRFIVAQAAAQFVQAEQDLILRVTQAYFDVVVAQENIVVAQAQMQAVQEQLKQAKGGFEKGTHAITDVHEAQSRLALATSQWVAARNELANKQAALTKVVGQEPGPLSVLEPAVVIPKPQPDNLQAWINRARERNPAVQARQSAVEAARIEVRRSRAEYLPTLDLTASYGKNYASGSTVYPVDYATRADQRQASVQLSMPIFSGGATRSRVTEATANEYRAWAELEAVRRQVAGDVQQAYTGIENGLAQIEALQAAVESSQSAVKGNRVGFGLGIRTNIDVLNAEQQFYTVQRDLAKARYDTLLQGIRLKAEAGVLTEDDVLTINTLLVPLPSH